MEQPYKIQLTMLSNIHLLFFACKMNSFSLNVTISLPQWERKRKRNMTLIHYHGTRIFSISFHLKVVACKNDVERHKYLKKLNIEIAICVKRLWMFFFYVVTSWNAQNFFRKVKRFSIFDPLQDNCVWNGEMRKPAITIQSFVKAILTWSQCWDVHHLSNS